MLFTEFDFKEPVLRGLKELGYEQTTPIQEQTITAFTSGKNIVGQSQTGTGKTAAFTLPLLNVIDPDLKKIQAIILVPTRELAVQTQEEFFSLGRYARIRALAAFGGRSIHFQKKLIDEGMHVAVCTPGRAIDLIERKFIDPTLIKYFVLDEVDRMLDMGFVDDVERLRSQCPNISQTMLFSATITSEVKNIISKHLGDTYHFIAIEPEKIVVDKIDHAFMMAPHISKPDMLLKWIESHKEHKIIIFTQTKYATNDLTKLLYQKWYKVGQLSGDLDQRERMAALKAYKENQVKIMVATDVASRGLNMKDIDLVINYDVPQDPESYVHRIGRTARAGKEGKAIMFVTDGEMKNVQVIERRNKIKIKQVDEEGNEVVRQESQRRSGGGRFGGGSRFSGGRSGGGRFGGGSRFRGAERRPFGSDRGWERRPYAGGGERRSFSSDRWGDRGGRFSGSSTDRGERRPFTDRGDKRPFSPGWERRPYAGWGDRRPPRPTTKSLLADFLPESKPERGSYRGRE